MQDLKTSDFDFDLPAERIAQTAVEPRDHARLLRVMPTGMEDHHIYDLPDLLRAGDLLVINDTRVIPARLYGMRGAVKVEVLLHKKQAPSEWLAFARPGKRLRVGDTIIFASDFTAVILAKHESGEVHLRFNVVDDALLPLLQKHGEPPLPPYIKCEAGTAKADNARYQTVYATRNGAVAAPTAGLHFTPELLAKLKTNGIDTVTVTLHVGAGTFLPVKAEHIKDHIMHAEWGEVSQATAEAINKAHREGQRVIAVGTTSLRVIESAADEKGVVHPFSQDTAIFITPGYRFRAIDALLTNFHLPQSTLFMLVSAFMGLEVMRKAYDYAIKHDYRFYSYGDASLLERIDKTRGLDLS
ncbi:MAG: tRNA preQ1(34) S-adenosylmethionine ribosyltransferase-isomerase QueA [Alphaproteobacteria bacterium]